MLHRTARAEFRVHQDVEPGNGGEALEAVVERSTHRFRPIQLTAALRSSA
jgi:hypothetical protein